MRMRRTVGCASVMLAITAACASAQEPPDAYARRAQLVAAAERAGAAHPMASAPARIPTGFASSSWAGTPERKCVTGGGIGPMRSGEFIIGGQLGGSRRLQPMRQAKIWWAPLHNSLEMDSLIVRGRNLSGADTVRLAFGDVAWPTNPGASWAPTQPRDFFWPSGTTIPAVGEWLLVAASGSNWGCFILTVR